MKYKVTERNGRVDSIEEVGNPVVQKIPEYLEEYVIEGEVICVGGQRWGQMTSQEKSELLEVVEQCGQNRQDYVHYMESMYPRNPRGK